MLVLAPYTAAFQAPFIAHCATIAAALVCPDCSTHRVIRVYPAQLPPLPPLFLATLHCSVFVSMFMLLLIVVLGIQAQSYNWLWQWLWIFDVIFEILNFTVLCAVCVIWRPTRSSGLLAYSKQV